MGSVMSSWWRVGIIGTGWPASAAIWPAQAPAASMTIGASIGSETVSTPVTLPFERRIPVTARLGRSRAPWRAAAPT